LERKCRLLHLFKAKDRSVEAFLLLLWPSNLHQCLFLHFWSFLNPLHFQLFRIALFRLLLALVRVVVGRQLNNPVGVDLAPIVDIVLTAFDDLMVDNPFGVYH
jgi:hypothetical protein